MKLFLNLAMHFMCQKNSKKPSFATIVSILGIMFGVSSFLVIVTVLNSFEEKMKYIILSANPNIAVFSNQGIENVASVQNQIADILKDKLQKQSSFVYQESVLAYKAKTSSVYLRAIEGTKSASVPELEQFIFPAGSLSSLDIPSPAINSNHQVVLQEKGKESLYPHIILGQELARSLNASVGSVVKLMSFESSGSKIPLIKYSNFYVTGLLTIGLSQFDKSFAYMNFSDGLKLFGTPGWASGIEIKLTDSSLAKDLASSLSEKINYQTVAWEDIDAGLFHQISRDSSSIKLIVFIISLVAAFNIVVTLSLTVLDRSKQISLLRSLGARKKQIIFIFLLIGAFVGLLGSIFGVLFGTILLKIFSFVHLGDLKEFYYLDTIPVHLNGKLIFFVVLSAIFLSFLGSIFPAYKASKISPILGLK